MARTNVQGPMCLLSMVQSLEPTLWQPSVYWLVRVHTKTGFILFSPYFSIGVPYFPHVLPPKNSSLFSSQQGFTGWSRRSWQNAGSSLWVVDSLKMASNLTGGTQETSPEQNWGLFAWEESVKTCEQWKKKITVYSPKNSRYLRTVRWCWQESLVDFGLGITCPSKIAGFVFLMTDFCHSDSYEAWAICKRSPMSCNSLNPWNTADCGAFIAPNMCRGYRALHQISTCFKGRTKQLAGTSSFWYMFTIICAVNWDWDSTECEYSTDFQSLPESSFWISFGTWIMLDSYSLPQQLQAPALSGSLPRGKWAYLQRSVLICNDSSAWAKTCKSPVKDGQKWWKASTCCNQGAVAIWYMWTFHTCWVRGWSATGITIYKPTPVFLHHIYAEMSTSSFLHW